VAMPHREDALTLTVVMGGRATGTGFTYPATRPCSTARSTYLSSGAGASTVRDSPPLPPPSHHHHPHSSGLGWERGMMRTLPDDASRSIRYRPVVVKIHSTATSAKPSPAVPAAARKMTISDMTSLRSAKQDIRRQTGAGRA
jgi:hypothetical protein